MEAFQILKFLVRNGRTLSFTEGLSYAEEIGEMELSDDELPEDIHSYVQSMR